MPDLVVDQGPGSAGTTLNAALLDAVVVAQSHVYNYTIPATSATLTQTFPSSEVTFNNGDNTGSKVVVASSSFTLTASNDNYIDVTPGGAYVLAGSVAINAAAPAIGTGNVRVYKATTGASTVAVIVIAGPTQPLNVTQVQNAVQLNPASQQAGSINVSALTGATLGLTGLAGGLYRNVAYQQNAHHMYLGTATTPGTTGWTSVYPINNVDFPVTGTTTRGGALRFRLDGHIGPTFGTNGHNEVCQWRINYDGGTGYVYLGGVEALAGQMASDVALCKYVGGLSAGSHTFSLEFNISGSTQQWQCLTDTDTTEQLVFTIDEF